MSPRAFFCALLPTDRRDEGNDQVQARIHLARRLRARPEPAQQDEGGGVRRPADPRGAARSGASTAARRARPKAATRTACCKPVALFPDPAQDERHARDVRGAPARRDAAPEQQPRDDPGRSRHLVRLRAGVLPLPGRRPARLPARRASRRRRASTTRASATRTSATSPARSSTPTSTSASRPASTTRASTPRSPRASGSSRSSARARSGPPTRSGSPATCCCASARSIAST